MGDIVQISSPGDALSVMKKSKTNFFYSFVFLDKKRKDGLKIIYAFCRKSDDIVDDESLSSDEKRIKLDLWEEGFRKALGGSSENEFLSLVAGKIREFNIPEKPFYDLLRGMRMDITVSRYNTFAELYEYCYCVASSVGLITIRILGYLNPGIEEYAVNLGTALQLTNIIRDVKKDILLGRIYIPAEDLLRFGCSADDIKAQRYNNNFIELMKFQCSRAKEYYAKADKFLADNNKARMLSARIIEHIYLSLLKNIEKAGFNVFERNFRVSNAKKLFLALGVFLKYKLLYKTN